MLKDETLKKVRYLLVNYPHLRGDDMKLAANLWYFEGKAIRHSPISLFFQKLVTGQITSPVDILRSRQKVQELYPELKVVRIKHQNGGFKDRVQKILENYPKARDNDSLLLRLLWNEDLIALHLDEKDVNLMDFLKLLSEWKVTRFDTVRRTRQKLQEQYPQLRGKKYAFRQSHQWTIAEKIKQTFEGEDVS